MKSYSYLMSVSEASGGQYIELLEERLHDMLRYFLGFVKVDEAYYRAAYHDVDAAIRLGGVASAKAHYMMVGYFENRLPHRMRVDSAWYLRAYPDVAVAIAAGAVASAADHFERYGFKEGRQPALEWSLIDEPAAAPDCPAPPVPAAEPAISGPAKKRK